MDGPLREALDLPHFAPEIIIYMHICTMYVLAFRHIDGPIREVVPHFTPVIYINYNKNMMLRAKKYQNMSEISLTNAYIELC